MNVPSFVISTRKVFSTQLSFLFSVHSYIEQQVIGVILSVACLIVQAYLIVRSRENGLKFYEGSKQKYKNVEQIWSEEIWKKLFLVQVIGWIAKYF